MVHDAILYELLEDQQFLIAADRYEELTGDSALAAVMRVEGLEWHCESGKPELFFWDEGEVGPFGSFHHFKCGNFDFGIVGEGGRPAPLDKTPIPAILAGLGITNPELESYLYHSYVNDVEFSCRLW